MRFVPAAVVVASLLSNNIQPQTAPSTNYKLRYHFALGLINTYSFRITVKSESGGLASVTSGGGAASVSVLQVNRDGSAEVAYTMRDFRSAGSSETIPESTLKYTMNALGRTRNENKPPSKLGGRRFVEPESMMRIWTLLPEKLVKLGDSWQTTIQSPFVGGGTVIVKSTLFRLETIGTYKTVRIHQTLAIPISMEIAPPGSKKFTKIQGTLKINTASNFAPELGKVVRSNTLGACTFYADTGSKNPKARLVEALKLGVDVSLDLRK